MKFELIILAHGVWNWFRNLIRCGFMREIVKRRNKWDSQWQIQYVSNNVSLFSKTNSHASDKVRSNIGLHASIRKRKKSLEKRIVTRVI